MSPGPKTIILAAVERSAECGNVVGEALALARHLPAAELHLVHVVDDRFTLHVGPVPRTKLLHQAREMLDELVPKGEAFPCCVHVEEGAPAKRILELALQLEAGIVVVGAGTSRLERLLGSVTTKVTHEACCPVLVARAVAYPPTASIEPTCQGCAEVRAATGGEKLWCTQHEAHHVRPHTFSEVPSSFGVGSTFLRPNG